MTLPHPSHPIVCDPQPGTKLAEAGSLQLPHTPRGETWELKVELRHNSRPGTPVLRVLDVIVLKLQVRDWRRCMRFCLQPGCATSSLGCRNVHT